MNKINIYAPWVIFYRQIEAFFAKDSEVKVSYDEKTTTITVRVDNAEKANALRVIMPPSRSFGNITVRVNVVPSNFTELPAKFFQTAFEGNEAFSHMTTVEEIPDFYISNPISYCSFKKEVVQYPADDLSSETGMKSTLYEDLAREIFENNEISNGIVMI